MSTPAGSPRLLLDSLVSALRTGRVPEARGAAGAGSPGPAGTHVRRTRYLRELEDALVAYGVQAVPALIDALGSADGIRANVSKRVLSRLGISARDEIREAMHDPDGGIRAGSLDVLAGIDREAALAAASTLAGSDPEPRVRAAALAVLMEAAVPAALAALVDPAPDVRRTAIDSLGRLGAGEAMDALMRLAGGDPDPGVRAAAVGGLSYFPDRRVTDFLARELASGDWQQRRAAAIALGRLPRPGAADALVTGLDDPVWDVRVEIEWTIRLHPNGLRAPLRRFLLDRGRSSEGREMAARLLAHLKDRRAVRAFCRIMEDAGEPAALRRVAAARVGDLGDRRATACLLQALDEGDPGIRLGATVSLGKVAGAEALSALARLAVEDPAAEVRESAELAARAVRARARPADWPNALPVVEDRPPPAGAEPPLDP